MADPYANLSNTFQEMTRNLIAMKGQQMQQALSEAELGMRGNQFLETQRENDLRNYGMTREQVAPGTPTLHERQLRVQEAALPKTPEHLKNFGSIYGAMAKNELMKYGAGKDNPVMADIEMMTKDPTVNNYQAYQILTQRMPEYRDEMVQQMADDFVKKSEDYAKKGKDYRSTTEGKQHNAILDALDADPTGAAVLGRYFGKTLKSYEMEELNTKAAIDAQRSSERAALANPETKFMINKERQYVAAGMNPADAAVKAYEDLSELKAKTAKAGKIDIRMSPAGGGGFSGLGANDKNFWFEQYELTGKLPPFAYRDVESRNQFTKGYAQYQREKGNTAADAYGVRAQKDAQKSAFRDLEKRDVLQNTFINKIEENSNTVMRIAEKYGNNWNRVINLPVNKASQILGSGDYAALRLALKSTSNEIAKVESGSLGIAEVSATQAEYMAKIHDPNLTVGEMLKVIEMGRELGRNAKKAVGQQKKDLLSEMSGRPRAIPDQPAPPNPGRRSTDKPDPLGIRR